MSSWITHIRNPFRGQRYTRAQAAEMQALHRLYAVHLADYQPITATPLALAREGDYARAQHSTVTIPLLGEESTPLSPFVHAMVDDLSRYLKRRDQRWFRYGYANDPMRLFCGLLMGVCQDKLLPATCQRATLEHLAALQRMLEAIELEDVFAYDPDGHGGMSMLLHNLIEKLEQAQAFVRYIQERHVARDSFQALQQQTSQILNTLAQYLWVCHSDQSHDTHDFSIVGFHTTKDEKLKKALNNRAGHLLMQSMMHQSVTQFILPQQVNLRPSCQPETWLCTLAEPDEDLVKLLQQRGSGIAGCLKTSEQIQPWLHLHRLLVSFAEYQGLVHACWQLAGFGGDQLIYVQLAELMQTVMTAYRTFNQGLLEALTACHQIGNVAQGESLSSHKNAIWRKNHLRARSYYHSLQTALSDCDQSLVTVIEQTKQLPEARTQRADAQGAYQQVLAAQALINRSRHELGLAPQSFSLDGTVNTLIIPASGVMEGGRLPPRPTPRPPQVPRQYYPNDVADVIALMTSTPMTLQPIAGHSVKTLQPLANSLYQIQQNTPKDTESTSQRLAQIKTAQKELEKARARTQKARQGYYWFIPWHWSTIRKLTAWTTCFDQAASRLHTLQSLTKDVVRHYARIDAYHQAQARLCDFFNYDEPQFTLDQLLCAKVRVFNIHQDPSAQAAVIEAAKRAVARSHWHPHAITLLLALKQPQLLIRYTWKYLEKCLLADDIKGLFAHPECWRILARSDCSKLRTELASELMKKLPSLDKAALKILRAGLLTYPDVMMNDVLLECRQRLRQLRGKPAKHSNRRRVMDKFKRGIERLYHDGAVMISIHHGNKTFEICTKKKEGVRNALLYLALKDVFPAMTMTPYPSSDDRDQNIYLPWNKIDRTTLDQCQQWMRVSQQQPQPHAPASPEIPTPKHRPIPCV